LRGLAVRIVAFYMAGFMVPLGAMHGNAWQTGPAFCDARHEPEVAQRLRDLGLVLDPGTPEARNEFLAAERTRWSNLVKEIGLQPE